jgi:hypothetical protein
VCNHESDASSDAGIEKTRELGDNTKCTQDPQCLLLYMRLPVKLHKSLNIYSFLACFILRLLYPY